MPNPILILLCALCVLCGNIACQEADDATDRPMTVASLSPAATDLILGAGLDDRLVAVSSYDSADVARGRSRPCPTPSQIVRGRSGVGDYLTIDWEKLAEVRPRLMIIQVHPDRMPDGGIDRARAIGATVLPIQIDRLDDIPPAMRAIGQAIDDAPAFARMEQRWQDRLETVRARVAGREPVRVLIVLNEQATFIAGSGSFLDDVVSIAGGRSAIGADRGAYPTIDREILLAAPPEAIVQIRPNASPAVLASAEAHWKTLPDLPAVRDGRVYVITEPWAMLPGYRQAELAERLAEMLHPAR